MLTYRLFSGVITSLLIISLGIGISIQTAAANADKLFIVKRDGLFGYMNEKAQLVIEPQFLLAREFSEGLAPVFLAKKTWALINTRGEIIVECPGIEDIQPFSEGLAGYSVRAKYGFIDKQGTIVIPAKYDWAYTFSNGLALVGYRLGVTPQQKLINWQYGYIDKEGNVVIDMKFKKAYDFSEGLAPAQLASSDFWGYIDKTGNFVLNPIYKRAGSFSQGLAPVSFDGETYGYIDKKGKIKIVPQFSLGSRFSEGLAAVLVGKKIQWEPFKVIDKGKWGYIDTTGKLVIEPQFAKVGMFKYGLACIQDDTFSETLVLFSGMPNKNRWGYIDKTGKFIWPLAN